MDIDLVKVAQVFAAAHLAPVFHIHESPQIHDNTIDKFYLTGSPEAEKDQIPASRLSLFIPDRQQLRNFMYDLAVCASTRDVCLAVKKLCGGKICKEFADQTFATALIPHLKFDTTPRAIYQALYKC